MPRVRPRISWAPLADFFHRPWCIPDRSVEQLPVQADDFTHDQFSHTACVGERRVEHGDAGVGCTGQINLIGADTEAPHSASDGSVCKVSASKCVRERMPIAMASFSVSVLASESLGAR